MKEETKVVILKYAESLYGENRMFRGGSEDVKLPLTFAIVLLIKGDRKILVDAGCDEMPGWDMKYMISPPELLERYGISRYDITDLIITHAHRDHIQDAHYFKNATVYMQKGEYERAGHVSIPEDRKVVTFDQELTICEDISIVRIGGHTPDSCIVTFPKAGKIWVISGDECYHERSFTEMIPVGNCANPDNSMAFLEEYGKDKYKVIVMHSSQILPGQNGFVEL